MALVFLCQVTLKDFFFFNPLKQWFPECGLRPPGGAQEILKGGARCAKLFYSLKINKKHKYN
jgi:hypothetical protein